ncbi:hypothetical protein GK047_16720 [Paenibacillus sp. SYP-B3998]|uniref:Uncharacterized protein n=1 Tax=Paenibacillus sp. SYP-B3998 TaxID=2678564 RepID=A0A6G3ZZJ7_9BACL|nr:DUF6022 family protein [Paenibacillus sp. SYP-B3998]NEW07646.1 hypothetical protein [Paenibacillus sp. SYP-B3998]
MGELVISFDPSMSMKELGGCIENYVSTNWKKALEENMEEFIRVFPELEDSTYGLYFEKLMPPVFEALEKAGFTTLRDAKETDYIIAKGFNFRNSMEKWGPEDHRSRVFWFVIEDQQQNEIGTLIFDFFHSHTLFDVPSVPQVSVLEVTSRKDIIAAIERMKEGK